MSQISPPFRIAILAMLAVCAVWFTVLKPKAPSVTATPAAPGTTGLANDVRAAKRAGTASAAANADVQRATGGTSTAPSTTKAKPATAAHTGGAKKHVASGAHAAVAGKTAGAEPAASAAKAKAAATSDPSTPLLAALEGDKAVVLVFWNRHSSNDRAVRKAAADANRRNGRVVVKAAPIATVGEYDAITQGVQVLTSPTVVVMAPGNTATTISGFTTTAAIDEAVGDALRGVKRRK